jgi:hypothetical protein
MNKSSAITAIKIFQPPVITRFYFFCQKDGLGSDGMPHGIEYGLKMSLFPPFPNQKLTLDEFVAGYCKKDMNHGYIDIKIGEDKKLISYKVSVK